MYWVNSAFLLPFLGCVLKVINLGSNTFSNPIFQKVLKKLAIILGYKRPWMICLALLPRVVFDLKLPQNHFNKKCSSKILFLKKKIRKIWMIFDVKNSL